MRGPIAGLGIIAIAWAGAMPATGATHHRKAPAHHTAPAKHNAHHTKIKAKAKPKLKAKGAPKASAPHGVASVPAGGIKLYCGPGKSPLMIRKMTQGSGTTVTVICR